MTAVSALAAPRRPLDRETAIALLMQGFADSLPHVDPIHPEDDPYDRVVEERILRIEAGL